MKAAQRTWVSLAEAAREVGVSMTTIRDWYRSGVIESKTGPSGRVVDVEQVRQQAMGFTAHRPQSGLQDRVADGDAEHADDHSQRQAELTSTLRELQEIARQRLGARTG
jgi:predicted site-specific integrase-resolvase